MLYAAEEKALETILEQKHRRRELQRAELAAEKKQLKKAKAQRRDERAREMEALENIVLHALEAERSQAEAVLAQAQAEASSCTECHIAKRSSDERRFKLSTSASSFLD